MPLIVLVNYHKVQTFFKAQLLLGFFVIWTSCSSPRTLRHFSGETMGTTYSIKIIGDGFYVDSLYVQRGIDSVLTVVNGQMSTWDPKSEISLFNQSKRMEPIPLSPELFFVVNKALEISKITEGAFDITVFDLMSLWGFGPKAKNGFPKGEDIEKVLSYSGWEKINLKESGIQKLNPALKIDLNSIAKGYGVDQVFNWLQVQGFKDIFVEIGGEVRCFGRNQKNKLWSIGIENPNGSRKPNQLYAAVVNADGIAIATSGNYRNFVNINGEILGHTINPKSGYPIKTDVLSVTVLSNSCLKADGWATALMAMDYKKGLKTVDDLNEIKAIWILEYENGSRKIARSDGVKVEDPLYEIIR